MSGRYADLSSFNPENINWQQYAAWSAQDDGIARVALRVSQGIGVPDTLFQAHYANAKAAGVQEFIFYHFAYPWLHPGIAGAQAESDYFISQLPTLGPHDLLMLDAESYNGQSGPASWYYDWLQHTSNSAMQNAVAIYANPSYIASNLQDGRLAAFPLILADWTFNPSSRPAAPVPWSSYLALQYTDKGVAGGIPEAVDLDIFLGGPHSMLPDGWTDDTNSGVLTAPNGVTVKDDFRLLILTEPCWRRENVPVGPDYPANPLTISDPTIGAGQRQDFEYCSLGWTASVAHAFFLGTTKEIALLKAQPAPTPPPVPEPVVPALQSYTVAADDTSIQQIAQKLHLGSWFSELYQPNMDEIETAARGAGHPNSDYGATVVTGTVLRYRA